MERRYQHRLKQSFRTNTEKIGTKIVPLGSRYILLFAPTMYSGGRKSLWFFENLFVHIFDRFLLILFSISHVELYNSCGYWRKSCVRRVVLIVDIERIVQEFDFFLWELLIFVCPKGEKKYLLISYKKSTSFVQYNSLLIDSIPDTW